MRDARSNAGRVRIARLESQGAVVGVIKWNILHLMCGMQVSPATLQSKAQSRFLNLYLVTP